MYICTYITTHWFTERLIILKFPVHVVFAYYFNGMIHKHGRELVRVRLNTYMHCCTWSCRHSVSHLSGRVSLMHAAHILHNIITVNISPMWSWIYNDIPRPRELKRHEPRKVIFLHSRQSFLETRYCHSFFSSQFFFFFLGLVSYFQYDWNYPNPSAPHPRGVQCHRPWCGDKNYHT